ncbi:MAG: YitT family protein [Clostridia bacterium]|nr:YitT family protein [Clostridia bacterium]
MGIVAMREHLRGQKYYEYLLDAVFCVVGSFIYGVSVSFFTAPNKIAPGGVTGISTILFYLVHTPIGVMIFVLNIPLFVLGLRFIGGSFMVKSIICTALTSVSVDGINAAMAAMGISAYHGNDILAALYGGVLSGLGLAMVFLRNATTGGTDIASRLLKIKFPQVSMGRMMLIIDAFIIAFSAIAFRSIDSALYAMIAIFTSSRVIDSVLYGADTGRMAIIISKNND